MRRYGRVTLFLVWIGGMVPAIAILQRGVGLAVGVERLLAGGSALVSALAHGWYGLVETEDSDGDYTIAGSRVAYGVVKTVFWLSLLLSSPALTPGDSPAAGGLNGSLGAVPLAVFVLTFVVLVMTTDDGKEFAPRSLRQRYRRGKFDRLNADRD